MASAFKECVDTLIDIYKESIQDIKEIGAIKRFTQEEAYNVFMIVDPGQGERKSTPIQVTLGEKEFFPLIEYGQENGSLYEVFKAMHEKVKKYANGMIHDISSVDEIIEKFK